MMLAGRVDLLSTVACFPLEEIFLPPYYSTQCVVEIMFRKTVNGDDKKLYIIRITDFFFEKVSQFIWQRLHIGKSLCNRNANMFVSFIIIISIEKFKNHNSNRVGPTNIFDRKMFTFLETSLVLR